MRKVSISFLSHPWIIKGLIFPTSREGGVISQEVVRDGLADKAAAEQSPEPAETAGGRNAVGGLEAKGGPVGLGD